MSIPKIGSIPLLSDTTVGSTGGAFILSTPSKKNAVLKFNMAEIEICIGGEPYVVIRYNGSKDALSTFTNAYRLVQ